MDAESKVYAIEIGEEMRRQLESHQ